MPSDVAPSRVVIVDDGQCGGQALAVDEMECQMLAAVLEDAGKQPEDDQAAAPQRPMWMRRADASDQFENGRPQEHAAGGDARVRGSDESGRSEERRGGNGCGLW